MTIVTSDMLAEELRDGVFVYSEGLMEPPKTYGGILLVTNQIMFLGGAPKPSKEVLVQIAHSPVTEQWTENDKRYTRYPTFDPLSGAITNYRVASQIFRSKSHNVESPELPRRDKKPLWLPRSRLVDIKGSPYDYGVFFDLANDCFFGSGYMTVANIGIDNADGTESNQAGRNPTPFFELQTKTKAYDVMRAAYMLLVRHLYLAASEVPYFEAYVSNAIKKLLPEKLNGMTVHEGRIDDVTTMA